jgi:hypothetical protein
MGRGEIQGIFHPAHPGRGVESVAVRGDNHNPANTFFPTPYETPIVGSSFGSDVVSELERDGMRIQVDLSGKVGFFVLPHKMVEKRDGNNEWGVPVVVLPNNFEQLLFLVG